MFAIAPALGAFPSSLPIDSASLDDLIAGRDVCGDAKNRESCLRVIDCAEVDPILECTAAEPVWLPDPARGGSSGHELLFRRVLPVPARPHPNEGGLKESQARLVGSQVHAALPSAAALYDKSQVKKAHAEHCSTRYCTIPAALYLVSDAGIAYPSCKTKGFSGMYELGRDVLVGLRRADILFSWLRLDTVVGELKPLRRALGARPILTATTWAAVVHAVRAAGEPPEPSKPAHVTGSHAR